MKCPCCGNEMQSGFVRAMGRGGVCWVTENRPMGAAVGCPGFLLLGKAPHSETDHVPAQRCAACRMVTIASDPEYPACCTYSGTAYAVPLFCKFMQIQRRLLYFPGKFGRLIEKIRRFFMKLETKRRLSMLLLAVAVIFWLLRQLAVVYIPGVSALALAGAMLLLASGMDRSRSSQKAAVTLIFAFGLLNILFAIIELYGYFRA